MPKSMSRKGGQFTKFSQKSTYFNKNIQLCVRYMRTLNDLSGGLMSDVINRTLSDVMDRRSSDLVDKTDI